MVPWTPYPPEVHPATPFARYNGSVVDLLTTAVYYRGESLDDLWITWRATDGSLVKFATEPHTFVLKLYDRNDASGPVVLTKSGGAGFTSADTVPNLKVAWAIADLNISPGTYDGEIVASRVADGKKRLLPFALELNRRPGGQ